MKAMVLAAGFGTRLSPLTRFLPKPMFPVMNRPVLEYTLTLLRSCGIREIVVNLHHLSEKVVDHFGDGKALGVDLHYSREESILGTAGGIKAAQKFLEDGPFLVVNSDIFVDIDLRRAIEYHREKKSCLTLVLKPGDSLELFDPIEVAPDGRVVHFVGASSRNVPEIASRVTFTGIQIMEPEIFSRIPVGRFCGTTDAVFPGMVEEGLPVYGYIHEGYWNDMGNRASYLQLHKDIFDGKAGAGLARNPDFPKETLIVPPVFIGKECHIAANAQIGPYATLGDGCRIKYGAVVERSVCWDNVQVGVDATVRHSVLGSGASAADRQEIAGQLLAPPEK
ncbi:MAG: NDP-sugar synthase [Nitrospinae bacterium]|nr:NDP-sugar synthase [Nitrospinota bacterium]